MPIIKPAPRIVKVSWNFWPGAKRLMLDETKLNHVVQGGIGLGKTHLGCRWLIYRIQRNLTSTSRKVGIIAPTHRILKRQIYPVFGRALAEIGLKPNVDFRFHKQDMVIELYKKPFKGFEVHLFSMENYEALVSWELDSAWWDEPGYGHEECKEKLDDRVGRNPGCKLGQILFTGVVQIPNWYLDTFGTRANLLPHGSYRLADWVEKYAPGYGGHELVRYRENENTLVMHGSSYENTLLNPQYFTRLWQTYGYKLTKFRAYVLGEAIAVNSLAVYDEFSEAVHVDDYPPSFKGENPTLNLCFDFNVGQMSLVVGQSYEGRFYAVWENGPDALTTEGAVNEFIERFPPSRYRWHELRVFGDSAGYARSTQLKTVDGDYSIIEDILEKAGYENVSIEAPRHTLRQETRVLSTNRMLGEGRLLVDRNCRKLITGYRKASWDRRTGKIKKGGDDDHTHAPEGFDYYIYTEVPPVTRPGVVTTLKQRPRRR